MDKVMRFLSQAAAILGLLVILGAFVGRFWGRPTVTILGHAHTATSLLLVGNTMLVISVLLAVLHPWEKK
jgi:hypothetical protein